MGGRITNYHTCLFLISFFFLLISSLSFAAELPNVVVVATGGTIAMLPDPKTGDFVPAITGEELVKAVPEIQKFANVKVVEFGRIDSREMNPEIWIRLSQKVNEVLADPAVTGVVVTHGTATMEETAYFLDLTVKSDKPVVLTGAMLSPREISSDGPRNLLNAVRQVVTKEAIGKGVTVTLNGKINAARDVRKTHTLNIQTFTSGDYGYLGEIDPDRVIFYRESLRRITLPLSQKLPKVDIVTAYSGADAGHIKYAVDSGAQGIIIEGFAPGGVGAPVADGIKYALEKGVKVVLSNRVQMGRAAALYGGPGGGATLVRVGVLLSDNLTPWKARILLMLALPQTKDSKELQTYFDK